LIVIRHNNKGTAPSGQMKIMLRSNLSGMVSNTITKQRFSKFLNIILLGVFVSTLPGCGQTYLSTADISATAISAPPGPVDSDPTAADVSSSAHPDLQPVEPVINTPVPELTEQPVITENVVVETPEAGVNPAKSATVVIPSESVPNETPPQLVPIIIETKAPPILYHTQAGDTRPAVAIRYGVKPEEITSPDPIPDSGLLKPDQLLVIPNVLKEVGPNGNLFPDSEVVYSPSALDFDIEEYVSESGGYLSTYREYLSNGWHTGAQVIQRVAIENSINPRLLLSLVEYRSHWVKGIPTNMAEVDYPLGKIKINNKGLYHQLSWAVSQLSIGYYYWRAGLLTEIKLADGKNVRLSPDLNAGTVALQYLLAQIYDAKEWGGTLYGPDSLPVTHEEMFGNVWLRAQTVEPLYPPDLAQPPLNLPYRNKEKWAYTGGPHSAWGPDGALAAVDFAPPSNFTGCIESIEWVTASATGLVVRAGNGVVMVDLDGDGFEQTGWAILYMHIATKDRVPVGTWLNVNDKIGHPSCEGGVSTGTHVHFARKYNGEWILADGPMPMNLSGWVAHAGEHPYLGQFTNGSKTAIANTGASSITHVLRTD
jgi:LasA protease